MSHVVLVFEPYDEYVDLDDDTGLTEEAYEKITAVLASYGEIVDVGVE